VRVDGGLSKKREKKENKKGNRGQETWPTGPSDVFSNLGIKKAGPLSAKRETEKAQNGKTLSGKTNKKNLENAENFKERTK